MLYKYSKDFNVVTSVVMTKFFHEGCQDICIHLELPFSFDMPLYNILTWTRGA